MNNDRRAGFDFHTVSDFLDAPTCALLVAEMRESAGAPASVYGRAGETGAVEERMRRVTRVEVSGGTKELVKRRLTEYRGEIEERFGIQLGECEEAQFLRYRVGDFFVAHQDGNTPLLRLERELLRRVSLIVFLNDQSDAPDAETYDGGSLVFSAVGARPHALAPAAGTLLAFRAETTHEVTPVTRGERFTVVSWFMKK